MKQVLILFIAVALFAVGCKKNKDEVSLTTDSSWTLGGTTYKAALSNKGTTSGGTPTTLLSFFDAVPVGASPTVNSINFHFLTAPTATGTYQLIGLGSTLTANTFQLSAGGPEGTYGYIGASTNITVTVTGGKIKMVIPEVVMKSTASAPDAKLTANVQEK